MVLFILCGFFVTVFTLYILSLHRYWRLRNVPYLFLYPLLMSKSLLCLQTSLACYLQQLYNRSKEKLVGFHLLGQPAILLRDPELIKQILVKDFGCFSGRTLPANFENEPVGGRVLFKLDNPEWKSLRSQMSPFFSTGSLRSMCSKMAEVSRNLVEYVDNHQNEVMHMKELCDKFSVEVISGCGFSFEGNCFKDENSKSIQAASNIFVCSFSRGVQFSYHFIAPLLVSLFRMTFLEPSSIAYVQKMFEDIKEYRSTYQENYGDFTDILIQILNEKNYSSKENILEYRMLVSLFRMTFLEPSSIAYVQKMFEDIKEYRSTYQENYGDFADILIQILNEKNYSTPEEVVAQAAQIWIAGFETVASTIMYGMYELARNKSIQQKLRMEINSSMNNKSTELNYDFINSLEYLEMFACETLRLYPSVPFADRKAKHDYRIPNTNMTISKGTNVYVSILGLHYDPELFPDPNLFDPDRFSTKNIQFIKPNSYLPFGRGPRNCIGFRFGKLGVKYAICSMVMNFEVDPVPYSGVKFDPRGFVLAPEEPIKLSFRKL